MSDDLNSDLSKGTWTDVERTMGKVLAPTSILTYGSTDIEVTGHEVFRVWSIILDLLQAGKVEAIMINDVSGKFRQVLISPGVPVMVTNEMATRVLKERQFKPDPE